MSSATLDAETVAALIRDLRTLADIDEIIVKDAPGHVDPARQPSLDDLPVLLADASIRGVQIRYRHDGAHWCDTLMPSPAGVRLVRIKHDFHVP